MLITACKWCWNWAVDVWNLLAHSAATPFIWIGVGLALIYVGIT